jgi:hypothetical protein
MRGRSAVAAGSAAIRAAPGPASNPDRPGPPDVGVNPAGSDPAGGTIGKAAGLSGVGARSAGAGGPEVGRLGAKPGKDETGGWEIADRGPWSGSAYRSPNRSPLSAYVLSA